MYGKARAIRDAGTAQVGVLPTRIGAHDKEVRARSLVLVGDAGWITTT